MSSSTYDGFNMWLRCDLVWKLPTPSAEGHSRCGMLTRRLSMPSEGYCLQSTCSADGRLHCSSVGGMTTCDVQRHGRLQLTAAAAPAQRLRAATRCWQPCPCLPPAPFAACTRRSLVHLALKLLKAGNVQLMAARANKA